MGAEEGAEHQQQDEEDDGCLAGLEAVFLGDELEGGQLVEGGELEGFYEFAEQ